MSNNLEFGNRSGPKTVITLFSYGGIHQATNAGLIDEMAKAAYVSGRAERANETLEAQGMPPIAQSWKVQYASSPQDALVSRSRSVAAQRFLEQTDSEVLIMLDHDLWWVSPTSDYEGDLLHIARQCADTKGIVGAAVSKKVKGQGVASMMKRDGEFTFGGPPILEPAWFVGAAFTAYHRDAIKRISEEGYLYGKHVSEQRMIMCAPGFRPIFMEMVVRHPVAQESWLHLSEDWALCHRAREVGVESFISCRPMVVHYGEYGFQVVRDAQPAAVPPSTNVSQQHYDHLLKPGAKAISLLHATRGRPAEATAAINRWMGTASNASAVEYLVSIDDDDPTMADWSPPEGAPVTVVVGGSRGCVDAYNRAYHRSVGNVVVQVHDDLTPPQNWDKAILDAIGDTSKPVALAVDDGLPTEVNRNGDLMAIAITTREFSNRLGGLFYPEYISMLCDDDLTEFAKVHGYRKDAKGLLFKHAWSGGDRDETQRRSYQVKNWEQGRAVMRKRSESGFPEVARG